MRLNLPDNNKIKAKARPLETSPESVNSAEGGKTTAALDSNNSPQPAATLIEDNNRKGCYA